MVYRRKKTHYGDTHLKRRWRTRSRRKDLDEIDEDLKPENSKKLLEQEEDVDKPGKAQFYCIHCSRYFINDQAIQDHFRTKVHKRRLKALELEPHTIEESERAAGFGSFKQPLKRKIETQPYNITVSEEESPSKKNKLEKDVLTPHIDFENRIQNKKELEENIKLRNLNIDIEKIEKQWAFYKHLDETKHVLEYTKTEIGKEISNLLKNPEGKEEEIEKLKLHIKLTKNDIKNVREYLYGIEEMAVLKALSLPNILHPRTPPKEPNILHNYLDSSNKNSDSHIDLGLKQDMLELNNKSSFIYLKNDAALFELAVINYVNNYMLDSKFMPFSNSNFARSVVVEGCGANFFNKNEIFTLETDDTDESNELSRTHLTGGASLYSFMAYFTKHSIQPTSFPLKFFTIGRNYIPSNKETPNLFNLAQYSQINCFIATINNDTIMDNEFDEIVNIIKTLYESLGYHFRLVYLPANQINKNESLRLSVQMYSNHLQKYVEVGYISIYEDFISKRLLFNYSENKVRKFPKVISGNILNVQKLLACAIEYNAVTENEILLNDLLKQYVPL